MAFVGFLTYASTGIYVALLGLYLGVYWSGGYRLSEIEYLRLVEISLGYHGFYERKRKNGYECELSH